MIRYIFLIGFLTAATLLNGMAKVSSDQFVDQKISDNRYSVIYVELADTSTSDAKQYALTHAAELVKQDGYRFFTLDAQQDVLLTQSQNSEEPFYGNMYEELIIQRDFGKRSTKKNTSPSPINTYPGLKILISSYKEKPSHGEVYDVCKLINCSGS